MTLGSLIGTSTEMRSPTDSLENPRFEQFALLVVEGYAATEAYRRAFDVDDDTMKPPTVRKESMRLRHRQDVADRIKHLQATVAERSVLSTSQLVADLEAMAYADINELVRVEVFNCRHCHGVAHEYQWIDGAEFAKALDAAAAAKGALPSPSGTGGFGFVPIRDPSPDCPQCLGNGEQRVRLGNTADASPGARKLFKGVELFPDGSVKRILLHDQLAARQELHRLRGLHVDRSISLSVTARIEPTRDMSPEQIIELMAQQRVLA